MFENWVIYLSNRTSSCEELVDHVDGDHPNGGHGHHDSDDMSPGGEAVVDVLHRYIGDDVEQDHTLHTRCVLESHCQL